VAQAAFRAERKGAAMPGRFPLLATMAALAAVLATSIGRPIHLRRLRPGLLGERRPDVGGEQRVTPTSFDMRTAPDAGGFFTGDCQGPDSRGNVFVPFFVQANSGNLANRTDVFASTATP
jgi:hypothetical protein